VIKSSYSNVDTVVISDYCHSVHELMDCMVTQVVPQCSRTDCQNSAVVDPRWDYDFCSVDCIVLHCRYSSHTRHSHVTVAIRFYGW